MEVRLAVRSWAQSRWQEHAGRAARAGGRESYLHHHNANQPRSLLRPYGGGGGGGGGCGGARRQGGAGLRAAAGPSWATARSSTVRASALTPFQLPLLFLRGAGAASPAPPRAAGRSIRLLCGSTDCSCPRTSARCVCGWRAGKGEGGARRGDKIIAFSSTILGDARPGSPPSTAAGTR